MSLLCLGETSANIDSGNAALDLSMLLLLVWLSSCERSTISVCDKLKRRILSCVVLLKDTSDILLKVRCSSDNGTGDPPSCPSSVSPLVVALSYCCWCCCGDITLMGLDARLIVWEPAVRVTPSLRASGVMCSAGEWKAL